MSSKKSSSKKTSTKESHKKRPRKKPRSSRPKTSKRTRKVEISYVSEICDMMYTFGDVRHPSEETAKLIEDIVRQYLVDLVNSAIRHAQHRRVIKISRDDVVFQIRKNEAQVRRLQSYLTWKDLRALSINKGTAASAAAVTRKSQLKVSWDFLGDLKTIGDEEEEQIALEPPEPDEETKERLRRADEITKRMSQEEYMEFSNRRKASFTYRKPKKFRDWLSRYISIKLNDDIVAILGYLAWEMVSYITQHSIDIKDEWESCGMFMPDAGLTSTAPKTTTAPVKKSTTANNRRNATTDSRSSLNSRDSTKTPLCPVHVREMMRRRRPQTHSMVGYTATHRYQEL